MINTMGKLMDSWEELLADVISVPVYKEESVPEDEQGNYVQLRAESEAGDDTKHSFRNDAVVITDIITVFNSQVDRSIVEGIDGEIKALLKSTPAVHNLDAQSGMQILSVVPSTAGYLTEYSDGKIYYRKVVRYTHRIIET
jgi:hypothetical protein